MYTYMYTCTLSYIERDGIHMYNQEVMRVEVPHNRQLAANLWHSGKTKLRCLHCNDLYIMHKKGLSTTKPFMRMVASILPGPSSCICSYFL